LSGFRTVSLDAGEWLNQARWLRMGGNFRSALRSEGAAARLGGRARPGLGGDDGTRHTSPYDVTVVLVWNQQQHVAILDLIGQTLLSCTSLRVGFIVVADGAGSIVAFASSL